MTVPNRDLTRGESGLHPLGYRKYYLLRVFGYAVRLHVWHRSREDPHERRWYVTGDGGGWIRYTCRPGNGGERPPLEPACADGIAQKDRLMRRPLRPYHCPLGEIHSYEPVGRGPHVSVVFLGRIRKPASTVWRRNNQPEVSDATR